MDPRLQEAALEERYGADHRHRGDGGAAGGASGHYRDARAAPRHTLAERGGDRAHRDDSLVLRQHEFVSAAGIQLSHHGFL